VGAQPRKPSRPVPARAHKLGGEDLDAVSYEGKGSMDRLTFLRTALQELGEDGWQTKLDTGWDDHDAEIYGRRWARLRLTSVAEGPAGGQVIIRCRLKAQWSLRAKLLFWALIAAEVISIALLHRMQPWLWMMLLTIPLVGWFLEQEKRNLQAMIGVVLDRVATELKMDRTRAACE
jgi:hypothetical protein